MKINHGIEKHVVFCGLHNHVVVECWKRMVARERMRHERPSPHQGRKQVNQVWRKDIFCSHCNRGGHQRATCWRLHLEKRLKDKAPMQEPVGKVFRQENLP